MQDLAAHAYNKAAMHVLMAAYFAHLLARTVYLSHDWIKLKDKILRF